MLHGPVEGREQLQVKEHHKEKMDIDLVDKQGTEMEQHHTEQPMREEERRMGWEGRHQREREHRTEKEDNQGDPTKEDSLQEDILKGVHNDYPYLEVLRTVVERPVGPIASCQRQFLSSRHECMVNTVRRRKWRENERGRRTTV